MNLLNLDKYLISGNRVEIANKVREIIRLIGEDDNREGLIDTPNRVAKMYEEVFSGYSEDPREVLNVTFNEDHNELVIVKDITYYSHCEHHMVPFFGRVHIGYYPNGKIAGLSKFARLVETITRRLQVQERITYQIANIISDVLDAKGVIVVVEGEHLCMCARGVKKPGSKTITNASRGVFADNVNLRAEFYNLIKI